MNRLPKTVTQQRRDCDLNPGPSAPESSALTTWLPSHPCSLTYCFLCTAHFSPGVSADLSTIFDVGGIVGTARIFVYHFKIMSPESSCERCRSSAVRW